MEIVEKKEGFIVYDTRSKRYYCKPSWSDSLINAYIFKSIDDLKLMFYYLKQHPAYLIKYNIKEEDLVYRKVTLKANKEESFTLLGKI